MKLTDYIANFIAKQGIKHIFGLTGAHIIHLIDSISQHPDLIFIPFLHEQGAAFAADAYARTSGNTGIAVSTSGPGAVNLISGICSAHFDSIPLVCFTGQVTKAGLKSSSIRQLGFQETPITEMMALVTKKSMKVLNPEDIRFYLEYGFWLANEGRPGTVLIDLPDDIQRAEINPEKCWNTPPVLATNLNLSPLATRIIKSQRPVIILGAGIHQAKADELTRTFIDRMGIPVLLTWGAKDLLPFNHPLNIGTFGTCGTRAGNFALVSADLILSIGARLNTQELGSKGLPQNAWSCVVDIDKTELEKNKIDFPIECDINDFLIQALEELSALAQSWNKWKQRIQHWKSTYPIQPILKRNDPYRFLQAISKIAPSDSVILTDAGATLVWTMQAWQTKGGQRLISSWNHSPMGYALPASVGASFGSDKTIICLIGDGSLQMNVQALATIAKWQLPIKVFVFDNAGYGIIRQTQDTWLEGRHYASENLGLPSIIEIASAYGINTETINSPNQFPLLKKCFLNDVPMVIDIKIDPLAKISPRLGKSTNIANLWPELPEDVLRRELEW